MRPGTYLTAAQDFREAVDELGQAILDALLPKLEWVCRMLTCFLSGFQAVMQDMSDWKRVCREIDDMGIEIRKPTFNAYLRDFHGIGRQEEGEK